VKPLADEAITTIKTIHQGTSMLVCPAALPLSSRTVVFTAGLIRRHRVRIGSPWRKLNPSEQAPLVLAYLRKGETLADLAAGFGIGTATAWRYVTETVALLADRSPKLRTALTAARKAGHAYIIIDGTLVPIDRVAADRPFYSGKHRRHGMNLQVISTPDGDIVWISRPLPGATHDLTAARIWGILRELAAAGLIVLADKGYHGAGQSLLTPYKGRGKPESQKSANHAHARLRGVGNAPTPSSRHDASCGNYAAAPGAPPPRQSHPRSSGPRDRRMKRLIDAMAPQTDKRSPDFRHGADRDGHFLAARHVSLLQEHVGHLVAARFHD
jgi:hypothetical protein